MFNQSLVNKARNQFVRSRADEIVRDPIESMNALIEAFQMHKTRTAKAIYNLRLSGDVDALLEVEDVIRKAAETMADAEWFKTEQVREAA